jgi:hypothetical protein
MDEPVNIDLDFDEALSVLMDADDDGEPDEDE